MLRFVQGACHSRGSATEVAHAASIQLDCDRSGRKRGRTGDLGRTERARFTRGFAGRFSYAVLIFLPWRGTSRGWIGGLCPPLAGLACQCKTARPPECIAVARDLSPEW